MTMEETAAKEIEVAGWMNKKGYDRRASKDVAPIIVKYLQSQSLPIDNVSNQRELLIAWETHEQEMDFGEYEEKTSERIDLWLSDS